MAAAPRVIAQQTASQYRRELGRQPPAYDKSLNPMSCKDIHERMMKLDAYDAQRTRENNGKHARKLLQVAQEGRLAGWSGASAAAELRVPGRPAREEPTRPEIGGAARPPREAPPAKRQRSMATPMASAGVVGPAPGFSSLRPADLVVV